MEGHQLSSTPQNRYRTTRPRIPLTPERQVVEVKVNDTLTIQLRPFERGDIEAVNRLRTQEAVMINTSTGIVDKDLAASQIWMDRFLPPNDVNTMDLMLWARDRDQPWENIGVVGCHILKPVPHIGYMLRTEWWGKSIATAAVKAFLQLWWNLERDVVEVNIDDAQDEHERHIVQLESKQQPLQEADGLTMVPEIMLAEIEENNIGSLKVVEKCGFQYRDREAVAEDNGTFVLLDYTVSKPF